MNYALKNIMIGLVHNECWHTLSSLSEMLVTGEWDGMSMEEQLTFLEDIKETMLEE